jgi:hypothetical protein
MKTTAIILVTLLALIWASEPLAASNGQVNCPRCSLANDAKYKYCTHCGAVMPKVIEPQRAHNEIEETPEPKRSFPPAVLEVGMSRTFHLKDKNIINGRIVSMSGDTMAAIETVDGKLTVPVDEILAEMVDIVKADQTRYEGPLLSEDEYSVSLKTPYGIVVVLKKDIQQMDRYFGDTKVSWQEEKGRFLQGEELKTIFLDPTASPLPAYSFYVSGLSLGYGFTDDFTLTSKFGSNLTGDLNLEPHLRIFHRASGSSDLSLALGVNLFSYHKMQTEAARYGHWIVKTSTGERMDDKESTDELEDIMVDPEEKQFFWGTYLVLSRQASLANGRGKWGFHLGAETNGMSLDKPELKEASGYEWDKKFTMPYRVWGAWDYDLSRRVKFMMEIFADNGHKAITLAQTRKTYFDNTPFTIDARDGDYKPVDFDFGFLWTMTETFRLGFHWQSPYVTFYWRW